MQLDVPVHLVRELGPAAVIAAGDHGDGRSLRARAAGAADAVGVGRDIPRHAEVDHVGDMLHVESTGGHVGSNEALDLLGAEGGHDAGSRGLVVAAVQGLAGEGHALETADQLIHVCAAVTEHKERVLGVRGFDQARQGEPLVVVVDLDPVLGDVVDGGNTLGGRNLEGIAGVVPGELEQRRREGRGEQQGRALLRRVGQDLADVVNEADLQHLVGLVKNHELGPREGQEALVVEVHHAAGGTDHKLGAILQGLDLGLGRVAANDQAGLDAAGVAKLAEHVVHLQGKLARRGEHKAQHRGARGVDHADHARAKGEGLAGAGLGLGDHILACEHGARGQALDRRRLGDAHAGDGGLDFVAEGPLGERLDRGDVRGGVQFKGWVAALVDKSAGTTAARSATAASSI